MLALKNVDMIVKTSPFLILILISSFKYHKVRSCYTSGFSINIVHFCAPQPDLDVFSLKLNIKFTKIKEY